MLRRKDSRWETREEQTDEVSLSSRSVFGLGQWAVDGPSGYVVVVLFVDAVGDRRAELKGEREVLALVPSIQKLTCRCVGTWAVASSTGKARCLSGWFWSRHLVPSAVTLPYLHY